MWEAVKTAFFDELEKISAINTNGLSPQTALNPPVAPPLQTQGYEKAKRVLDLASTMKIASDSSYEKARSWIRPFILGAGAGALIGSLTHLRNPRQGHRQLGAILGGAIAVADRTYLGKKKLSTAPGTQLKNSRIGFQFKGEAKKTSGPGLKSQTPLIGRLGTLPR